MYQIFAEFPIYYCKNLLPPPPRDSNSQAQNNRNPPPQAKNNRNTPPQAKNNRIIPHIMYFTHGMYFCRISYILQQKSAPPPPPPLNGIPVKSKKDNKNNN